MSGEVETPALFTLEQEPLPAPAVADAASNPVISYHTGISRNGRKYEQYNYVVPPEPKMKGRQVAHAEIVNAEQKPEFENRSLEQVTHGHAKWVEQRGEHIVAEQFLLQQKRDRYKAEMAQQIKANCLAEGAEDNAETDARVQGLVALEVAHFDEIAKRGLDYYDKALDEAWNALKTCEEKLIAGEEFDETERDALSGLMNTLIELDYDVNILEGMSYAKRQLESEKLDFDFQDRGFGSVLGADAEFGVRKSSNGALQFQDLHKVMQDEKKNGNGGHDLITPVPLPFGGGAEMEMSEGDIAVKAAFEDAKEEYLRQFIALAAVRQTRVLSSDEEAELDNLYARILNADQTIGELEGRSPDELRERNREMVEKLKNIEYVSGEPDMDKDERDAHLAKLGIAVAAGTAAAGVALSGRVAGSLWGDDESESETTADDLVGSQEDQRTPTMDEFFESMDDDDPFKQSYLATRAPAAPLIIDPLIISDETGGGAEDYVLLPLDSDIDPDDIDDDEEFANYIPPDQRQSAQPEKKKRKTAWILGGILGLGALAAGAWGLSQLDDEGDSKATDTIVTELSETEAETTATSIPTISSEESTEESEIEETSEEAGSEEDSSEEESATDETGEDSGTDEEQTSSDDEEIDEVDEPDVPVVVEEENTADEESEVVIEIDEDEGGGVDTEPEVVIEIDEDEETGELEVAIEADENEVDVAVTAEGNVEVTETHVPGTNQPAPTIPETLPPQPAEPETFLPPNGDFHVDRGEGFQRVFQDTYGLNGADAYRLYLALHDDLAGLPGTYMHNGEVRISHPGELNLSAIQAQIDQAMRQLTDNDAELPATL